MPVKIQSGEIRRKISEDINATNPGLITDLLTDYVVPMLLINDNVYYGEEVFSNSATATNATSATILTTDSVKTTYLTGLTLSVIKDVTATSLASAITVVINGATRTIASIVGLTLTVQNQTIALSFPIPLKVDRSSIIAVTNSTATGNVTSVGCVTGFLRRKN